MFTAAELKRAFEVYQGIKDTCSKTGDWTKYADLFPRDDRRVFVDHHGMGRFEGHAGVLRYITQAMKPYPNMTFPIDWISYDEVSGAVVFQVQNAFPPPFRADGTPFAFPNWTRVVYTGNDRWLSEETVYNPLRDAQRVVKEWRAAGGQFQSPEALKYKYSEYPDRLKKKEGAKL